MGRDLEDIIEAAGGGRERPALIRVGHAVGRGARPRSTGYFWSTGRVSVTVARGRVRIKRRLGVAGNGIELETCLLAGLAAACRSWARERDRWAAFYLSSGGYPPGYGWGAYYVNEHGVRTCVGRQVMGHTTGETLIGHDEIMPVTPTARRPDVVAEIWRRGERHGPTEGSLVGVRYAVGDGVYLDGWRHEARIWRGDEDVYLERGEEELVAALIDVT